MQPKMGATECNVSKCGAVVVIICDAIKISISLSDAIRANAHRAALCTSSLFSTYINFEVVCVIASVELSF